MNSELPALVAQVAELSARISEVSKRLRQDSTILFELQQELSRALQSTWLVCGESLPAAPPPGVDGPRMLRLADVVNKVGLSRSSIWKMVREQRFPQPRRLAIRAVRWVDCEIDEWLRSRKSAIERISPQQRR